MRAVKLIVAIAALGLAGAAQGQTYGSWCQTPDGGCVVAQPQPIGSYCVCGASSGSITG